MARKKDWNRILQESNDNYKYKFDYDGNNNPIYIGKVLFGVGTDEAKWQIKKLTYDANNNPTDIQYPSGDDDFQYIWDNRVSYSYS